MREAVTLSEWMRGTGPEADVVLSSRIRLARNVRDMPFPHHMDESAGERLIAGVTRWVEDKGREWQVELWRLKDLSPLDRQLLVEKHLASPLLVSDPIRFEAVMTDGRESLSVMVAEEDHVRLQVLLPGLQLDDAWRVADRLDDSLETVLDWAFDPRLGYLTAWPTNLGTGLRASVMVHLPALVLTRQAGQVFTALAQMGVVVRGLYGEGSEAEGAIFQISNQVSLGHTEEELVHNLTMVAEQVVGRERLAREQLIKQNRIAVEDRVGRAFGILAHARVLSSEEALRLLSDVQLGITLGLLPPFEGATFAQLVAFTRPAMIQKLAGRELDAGGRDVERAALIQRHLRREPSRA
jgi:protein arginine kinase